MLRQTLLVFGASMFLNVCGFVFHAIASRYLGVDGYGALYALISACTIVSLPVVVISPVIARFAAEFQALHDDAHMRAMLRDVGRGFGVAGAVCLVASVVAAGPVGAFLHVPAWSVPIVGAIGAMIFANTSFRAVAQGTQAFGTFALSVAGEGTFKVLALVAAMLLGLKLGGSILAFLAGSVVGFAIVVGLFARRYFGVQARSIRYDWRRIALSGVGAAAATIAMTLIGNVDVIIVKHSFNASDAGLYAAASQFGKIMLYLVGFIPMVLLPQATQRHVRGERTRHTLLAATGLFAAFAVCGLAGVKFFGLIGLHALVGHAYDAAGSLLVGYSTAMVLLAFTNLLASYGIATHRLAFAAPMLAGTGATLLAIVLVHVSLEQVIGVLVLGMSLTCAAVAGALLWQGWHSARLADAKAAGVGSL
jgi:O-antigen/teichoic acid export membrane protein